MSVSGPTNPVPASGRADRPLSRPKRLLWLLVVVGHMIAAALVVASAGWVRMDTRPAVSPHFRRNGCRPARHVLAYS